MRDVNTMGKLMYVLENIIWTYLAYKIYSIYLFVNLFDFDTFTSLQILIISMIIMVVLGVIFTIKHRRNSINTATNIALPLSLYSACGYFKYAGLFIIILLIVSVLTSVTYVVLTQKYSKSKASKKNRKFNKNRFCFLGVRCLATGCCSVLTVVLLGSSLSGLQLYRPTQSAVTDTSTDYSDYLNQNMDSILVLDSDWEKLGNEQKMNVLQIVCNIERAKFGIKNPIYVKSKAYMNELLACYNPKDYTVSINAKHLEEDEDTGFDILESCLHECYHSYQYELVNLYNNASDEQKQLAVFASAKSYKEEFANYKGGECFDEYYQQECEVDARSYARYEVQSYKNVINNYKKKG